MRILAITAELDIDRYSCSLCNAGIIRTLEEVAEVTVITEYKGKNNFGFKGKFIKTKKSLLLDKHFWRWKPVRYAIAKTGIYPPEKLRVKALEKATENELKKQGFDLIIALGSGSWFYPHYVLGTLKTRATKWAFIHDPFPSSVFPEPYTATEKTNTSEMKKFQKAVSEFDTLWFPSKLLAKHMQKWYEIKDEQVFIFPHIMFEKEIDHTGLASFPFEPNTYFLHTGNLLKPRKIHGIVEAFKTLKEEGELADNKKLVFVGPSEYNIDELASEDVIIVNKRVSYNTAMSLSQQAEKLLIIESDGAESPFLPGKVPQYIAMQKPILHFGPLKSEVNRIFSLDWQPAAFSATLFDHKNIKRVLLSEGFNFSKSPKAQAHWNKRRVFEAIEQSVDPSLGNKKQVAS